MAAVTDLPPARVRTVLSDLRQALDETVPAKVVDRNLLVGTWNIRAFGDLTDRWLSGPADSPKRDLAALVCIAEVLSRFDVVAVQEVRGSARQCAEHPAPFIRRLSVRDIPEAQRNAPCSINRMRPGRDDPQAAPTPAAPRTASTGPRLLPSKYPLRPLGRSHSGRHGRQAATTPSSTSRDLPRSGTATVGHPGSASHRTRFIGGRAASGQRRGSPTGDGGCVGGTSTQVRPLATTCLVPRPSSAHVSPTSGSTGHFE
jgi:hypothetical protein